MSKARAANPPKGQCRQCWAHAEDPDAHKHLGYSEDCQACIFCKDGGHAGKLVT